MYTPLSLSHRLFYNKKPNNSNNAICQHYQLLHWASICYKDIFLAKFVSKYIKDGRHLSKQKQKDKCDMIY